MKNLIGINYISNNVIKSVSETIQENTTDILNLIKENNTIQEKVNDIIFDSFKDFKNYIDVSAESIITNYMLYINLLIKERQNKLNWFQKILWKILGLWSDFDE